MPYEALVLLAEANCLSVTCAYQACFYYLAKVNVFFKHCLTLRSVRFFSSKSAYQACLCYLAKVNVFFKHCLTLRSARFFSSKSAYQACLCYLAKVNVLFRVKTLPDFAVRAFFFFEKKPRFTYPQTRRRLTCIRECYVSL